MSIVPVRFNDIDKALRRLKLLMQREEGTFREMKKRKHYVKPSERKKLKSEEARKRRRKGSYSG